MTTVTQHDIGKSLLEMQENLERLTQENQRSKLIQNGMTELNEILRGDKDLQKMGKEVLSFLAGLCNATVGTLYMMRDDGKLELIAGYALDKRTLKNKVVDLGVGLIGQVAEEKSCIQFKKLPKNYLKTNSSIGEAKPSNLLGIPMVLNDAVVGVIELGTYEPVDEDQIKLFNGFTETVAISLASAKSKQRTEQLLRQIRSKEAELSGQIEAINKSNLSAEFDVDGMVTGANSNFLEVVGYELDEIKGKHHSLFVSDEYAKSGDYKEFWKSLRSGEYQSGEFVRIAKDGKQIWIHGSYNPIFNEDGELIKVLKIAIDITEQKEKQLQSELQVACLNESAIVSETDADGNITFVNDMFCKISGYREKELIGKNHRILKSGQQPDGIFVGMWKAISLGRVWKGEICNMAKDGSFYWVATTITPFRNLKGEIYKYVAVRFDITDQVNQKSELKKQAEELQAQQEELQQSNEELEEQTQKLKEQQEELQAANEELEEHTQMIAERNKDLEKARLDIELKAKQLEISSRYKSEFLANMSHELRTPLNSLLILSNDLAANKSNNLNEEQVESANIIAKSGYDLLNLINEILDLSKIEAGKMELNITSFPLQDLAEGVKRNFIRLAEEKGLKLKVNLGKTLPEMIQTDRQRLEQVIKNLVSNAIKFTEEGFVKVDFGAGSDGQLNIVVSDSGIGVAEDKQHVIFEAFQQAEGGTARKYGGTGLGLSISRELAKLLGGQITLESALGKGSVFTVSIPIIIEKSTIEEPGQIKKKTPVARKESAVPFKANERFLNYPAIEDQRNEIKEEDHIILIIDDDESFSEILAKQAKDKGFKYLAAATGEDGLVLAEQFKPNAIILDLDLPGMDGHAVLKELKGSPDLRHIPVHIMSVNERSLDPIKSGAMEYLTKPISKKQLDTAFGRLEEFVNRKMKNLLIIEDDKTLRRAIVKLIGNGDVKCFEAGTAKEAIDSFGKQPVDCVVLDIGLPDMSGFELIKELEKVSKHRVPPIIVYTGRELSKKENEELQQYAETVIVKGVKSEERLLDETALFLHRTVKNLPQKKQEIITGLYDKETMFLGKRILLVDDDMRNVFALSKVLKEKGMEIIKADNGKVALKELEANPDVDLVLMDIMMPEMDGYECMEEIRKHKEFKDLPVIALTAKAMKEDRQKCIDAGANDYIAKPVDLERLLSLMRIWIRK